MQYAELWAKIPYDFIFAYELLEDKEDIMETLKPVYFARVASFYKETLEMAHQEAEEKIVHKIAQLDKCRNIL